MAEGPRPGGIGPEVVCSVDSRLWDLGDDAGDELEDVEGLSALDTWFEQVVKPRMRGRAFMVRVADDAVLVFEREDDPKRVMQVLPKRF